jgi:hypothetical protein
MPSLRPVFLSRLAACVLALPLLAPAAPLPVALRNPSFEEQKESLNGDGDGSPIGSDPGDFTANIIPQWSVTSGGLFNPDAPLNFAPDGALVTYLDANATLSQPLFFPDGSPVLAVPGLQLSFSAKARGRSGGQPSTSIFLRVGNTIVSNAATLAIPANPTGYSDVTTTTSLTDSAPLNQPLTLVITNAGQQLNLDAVSASVVYAPAITALSASPQPATAGQPVTVSWATSNAASLVFNGTTVTGQSSITLPAPATPESWTLSASNPDGTTSRSVLIEVLPAPRPTPPIRITEVLADNRAGLTDEDSSPQDWIEFLNTSTSTINLNGWFLSDNPAQPAKWSFPDFSVLPNSRFIVFASGKNRSTTPLHTNFRLSNNGESIVLSDPAGNLVSRLDLPASPPDVSYGIGTGPTGGSASLIPPDAVVRWSVPASPVSDDWRGAAPFDDSSWLNGRWELGFSAASTTAYQVAAGTVGTQSYSGSLGMDFDVVRPITITDLGCFDSSSNGLSRTITVVLWSRNQNGTPASTSDDTPGSVITSEIFSAANPGTLSGGQRFKPLATPLNLAPGSYTVLAYNYGTGEPNGNNAAFNSGTNSGSGALIFTGTSRYGVTAPPASPAASWPGSPDGGPAARYASGTFRFREPAVISTNTQAAMLNISGSALTRTAFPTSSTPLNPTLTISADDGFVAWLNGSEIARRNAPASLPFNASATAADSFTLSFPINPALFRPDDNILAIHGLNLSASDPDFRLSASISSSLTGEITGWFPNPSPGNPNTNPLSALSPLISEIHSDAPDSKSRFTEFVELFNPLPTDVSLAGWQLTGGISFTFPPGTVIRAGSFLVIGENPAHLQSFLAFSGALGPWSGNLRNEGDEITLRRPDLSIADRVNYSLGFPWPTVGDDPGNSMQRLSERLPSDLGASWRSALPSPGSRNSVTTANAPPAIRQVDHSPLAPSSNSPVTVTAKVTDPDGIAAVWLEYQIVDPGNYIRLTDPAYLTQWASLPMNDRGTNGDVAANDDVFSVTVPASLQQHRRLVRYRIRSWDGQLAAVRVPYPDDDCPDFSWFTYDGVPSWSAALRPGTTPTDTFPASTMRKVRAWHLLSRPEDVQNCQYNSAFNDGTYRFEGALIIDGRVYDHIHYRVKGQNSTYNTGKNKWKLRFNRGHLLDLPDNYGRSTSTVKTLNISSVPAPWAPWNRGMHGLDEAMAFRLSNLAGAPAPNSSYLHWRVIDNSAESGPSQFDGDFWGLYLAFENTDNLFKDGHDLPDGNIFRLQTTGAGNSVLGQGKGQPGDLSDLNAFTSTTSGYRLGGGTATAAPLVSAIQPESWFRTNVDLPEYFNWRAVTEAINQTDRREQENVVYFRRPPAPAGDGRWMILPWDCDLLYENFDRWGPQSVQTAINLQQYEQISRALLHPAILTEFQNRARELQDLLLNRDQAWKLVDEFLSLITDESPRIIPLGSPINDGFVEAERRRWDYNPSNPVPPRGAAATGNYYRSPYPIGNMTNGPPQPYNRTLASPDLEGMVQWVKEFIASGPNGGARLTRMAEGRTAPYTLASTPAITIPATPVISYSGPHGFPLNQLRFSSSAFNPTGGLEFAAIQWRLGEIHDPSVPGFTPGDPWRYEIEGPFTPPESAAFSDSINIPATGLSPNRTYRARVRHKDRNGRWSHWSDPLQFTASAPIPGDLSTHLVISEIMYNPPAPQGSDAEFIELLNTHPTAPLDLTGVSFTSGISFSFPPGASLAPGTRLVLAANPAVFSATYGPTIPVAGQFSGNLSNNGERITLSLGASTPLRDFTFGTSSPWPSSPDNNGDSLVLIAPQSNPDHANPLNWRASSPPNPGSSVSASFAAWQSTNLQPDPAADSDGDGLNAFAEYALGTLPNSPSLTDLPTLTFNPDRSLTFSFSRLVTADDVAWRIEESPDALTWAPASPTLIDRQFSADRESLSFLLPPTTAPRRFIRLHLSTH